MFGAGNAKNRRNFLVTNATFNSKIDIIPVVTVYVTKQTQPHDPCGPLLTSTATDEPTKPAIILYLRSPRRVSRAKLRAIG